MANKKKKDPGFPYDATPEVHRFSGNADSCFDMVNQYGTYEIQRTQDTENLFPLIMQGIADIGPVRSSMLATTEPVSATILSVLWLGTSFTVTDIIGFAAIISIIFLLAKSE